MFKDYMLYFLFYTSLFPPALHTYARYLSICWKVESEKKKFVLNDLTLVWLALIYDTTEQLQLQERGEEHALTSDGSHCSGELHSDRAEISPS